jgi:osmotically-inducible protein OsmY
MQAVRTKTDAQIKREVLGEFQWDSRVDETDVGVEVDKGVVTLTGTVSSYAIRQAAQEAAHKIWGVLDVANDIHVKLPGSKERTDTDIAQSVRSALRWNDMVPADKIQTTVSQGVVTLEGKVDQWYQREEAERVVRNLTGVKFVIDRLQVSGPTVEASKVKQSIEDALERRAERTANRIAVSVVGGTAKLSGTVRSWQERQAVVGAAKFTPGVHDVEDSLRIDPLA